MLSFWQLIDFAAMLDRWIAIENPSVDMCFVDTEWVLSSAEEPYIGVQRRPDVAGNYWFGMVPESQSGDHIVVCGDWIDEEHRSVRCDTIATLGLPIPLIRSSRACERRSHRVRRG